MSDTSSSFVDGKHISSGVTAPTGGEFPSQSPKKVIDIGKHLKLGQELVSEESIEPTRLYEYFSEKSGQFEIDAPLALISQTLAESLKHLKEAVLEQDQLERENHVSLAWSTLFRLAGYFGTWPAFDEALSLLFTAYESHRESPYSTSDFVALQKVLEMLRRNPLSTDDEITLIYDSLQSADFDLNAPLHGVDLNQGAEDL